MQEDLQSSVINILERFLGVRVSTFSLIPGRQAKPDGSITDDPATPRHAQYIVLITEMKLDVGGGGSAKGVDPLHQVLMT